VPHGHEHRGLAGSDRGQEEGSAPEGMTGSFPSSSHDIIAFSFVFFPAHPSASWTFPTHFSVPTSFSSQQILREPSSPSVHSVLPHRKLPVGGNSLGTSPGTALLAGGKEQVRQTMMLSAQVMLVLPAGLAGDEVTL